MNDMFYEHGEHRGFTVYCAGLEFAALSESGWVQPEGDTHKTQCYVFGSRQNCIDAIDEHYSRGGRCAWMIRWISSQPRHAVTRLATMCSDQWEWLMDKWHRATGQKRNRGWEDDAREHAMASAVLQAEMFERFRTDALHVVAKSDDYMELLDGLTRLVEERSE